jgi:hypothetical protein
VPTNRPNGVSAPVRLVVLDGEIERLPQLIEVLVVAELGALLEPFGGERLGSHPLAAAAVGQRDAHADHGLRAALSR